MKTLDIKPYKVTVMQESGETEVDYDVKKSLVTMLFASDTINFLQLRERNAIADKIEKATDSVDLEDAEFAILFSCMEGIKAFTRNDCQLVDRIVSVNK